MSLYRHINGKNNDRAFLEKKRKYITDPVKTDGGKLVGASACLSEHGIDDWISVKKAYYKNNGKQGEHITISLTPDRKSVRNEVYLKVAQEVAENIFKDYNCIYAVHIDSTYRHIHLLLNSVSYVDGKRFHSSKSDLAETRLAVNKILEKHHFDTIRASTDTMIDETPYDLSDGFDALEITEDQPDKEPFKDILIDASDDAELYDYLNGKKPKEKEKNFHVTPVPVDETIDSDPYDSYNYSSNVAYHNFNCYGEFPALNVNYSCESDNKNKGEKSKMFTHDVFKNEETTSNTAPAVHPTPQAVTQPVDTCDNLSAFPTMKLNFGPKITINAAPSTSEQDVKNYINAATPKIHSSNVLNCAVSMASELDRRNIHMNIEANIFPDITINVIDDNKNDGFNEGEAIDIDAKEVW